jgi:hypothetical protein
VAAERRVAELIELGRDREAAELAASSDRTQGDAMDVATQLEELGPNLGAAVGGLTATDLLPSLRDGDTFAAEVQPPPDATPMERLAAFTGRQL